MIIEKIIDPKFVVYKSCKMGWGNRLRGTLSVFILGLVTDRIFIQKHQMFTDNFKPPLIPMKNSKSIVPLKWDYKEYSVLCEFGTNIKLLTMHLDLMKKKNITEMFQDFDCIEHSEPPSFDARIYVNDIYSEKLSMLFGTSSRMERMRQVFRFLTSHPSQSLLDATHSLAKTLRFYNYEISHRVGIQARLFIDWPTLYQRVWENIHKLYLPCVKKMLEKKLKQLGLKSTSNENLTSPHILIYLTTDDENFRPFLRKELKRYGRVVFPKVKPVHTSSIAQNGTNSAVLEWYLLGLTSSIMTTGSSFGTMAWGVDGKQTEIIATPHKGWGSRLCGPYPDEKKRPAHDISWGHGGHW